QTFVLALDGDVIASENLSNTLLDLAVLRSLGIQVVLTFGACPQVLSLAEQRSIPTSSVGGYGPTDASTLDLTVDAVGRATNLLIQQLTPLGIRTAAAHPLSVRQAGVLDGVDQEFTGSVYDVDERALRTLLHQDILPVIAPVGHDRKGQTFALSSDQVSTAVGSALRVAKIIYVEGDDPFPIPGAEARQFSKQEVERLLADSTDLPPRNRRKLTLAVQSCEAGVPRVHFLPGLQNEAILAELFSAEGVGTMIHLDSYERIRRANHADVEAIHSLTLRGVQEGQLRIRSRGEVQERLEDYWVLEMDDNLVGIIALHVEDGSDVAEIASLFVSHAYLGRGYGQALVSRMEEAAQETGASRIFAYSTQASEFFVDRCQYSLSEDDSFVPAPRRELAAASARNARLAMKHLS
ncbi:MAG: amino-acid N-acetyltransferase, partial [Planctomycetota bacterium]